MQQKRTKEQIATSVFKALPHINKVWVDEDAQLFHLDARQGGTLVQRTEVITAEQTEQYSIAQQ